MESLNSILAIADTGDRPTAVRDTLTKLRHLKDLTNVALGQLLWEVRENRYYENWTYEEDGEVKHFKSVDQYAFIEHNYDRTSTTTFIRVYETFILNLGISEERINQIGWGKLKMLLPRVDEENVEEWLTTAEGNTQTDLREIIDDYEYENETNVETSTEQVETVDAVWVKHKFALTSSQSDILETAFKKIEEVEGLTNDGSKLEYLCATYLTSANIESGEASLADNMKLVERAFGVKLQIAQEKPVE